MSAPISGRGSPHPSDFRLGEWWVSPAQGKLTGDAAAHHAEPKAMEVLVYLAANGGRVVSKHELLEAVWPGSFIQEGALFRHVCELRRLLGDDPRNPRYIETIPKRGYRLIAELAPGERRPAAAEGRSAGGREGPGAGGAARGGRRRALPYALASLVLTVSTVVAWPGSSTGPRSEPGAGATPTGRTETAGPRFRQPAFDAERRRRLAAPNAEIAITLAPEATLEAVSYTVTCRYLGGDAEPREVVDPSRAGAVTAAERTREGGRLELRVEANGAAGGRGPGSPPRR